MDEEFGQLLKGFSDTQLKFIARRLYANTDKEAAEDTEIPYATVRNWKNKQVINAVVLAGKQDSVIVAREQLRRLARKAVETLDEGMDASHRTDHRLIAAKDVLDRLGVDSPKRVDVTSAGEAIKANTIIVREMLDGEGD